MSKPQDLTRSTSDSGAEAEHPRVVVAEDEALIRLDLVELLEESDDVPHGMRDVVTIKVYP